jgi:hypothetical protein
MEHKNEVEAKSPEDLQSAETTRGNPLPDRAPPHPILQLQQRIGNRAVQHMLTSRGVILQAKLTVGSADDQYEQDAVRLAEQVMSVPAPVTTSAGRGLVPSIQRQSAQSASPAAKSVQADPLTVPLTDSEWRGIDIWLSRGEVGIDPLTDDAGHNADLVAGAIFCQRATSQPNFFSREDPLLCLLPEITTADARVQALKQHVTARGPIINWSAVSTGNRLLYVMRLLVNSYHYPVNGAAGIVGNLLAESGVLPSRIEGSLGATPMRTANFDGQTTDYSPDDVMNRNSATHAGPLMPGVGLAQWTTSARRSGLFQRTSQGRALGSSILFNMDAQVEYLVSELQANVRLNASLNGAGVTATMPATT